MTIPRPTATQLAWQRMHFGVFFHFGVNTFHAAEWSDGTLPAESFDPTDFDADQWVDTARRAGACYVVLTAKHHDGFCLWPTETTTYSVRSSPWRAGQGDVVAEVADACRRQGLGMGIYLSPWDRNAACYSDPPAYDDFYRRQLTELCTRYGPLTEVWFDGAGSTGREYDWPSIIEVVRHHQPDAVVFNMGEPDIRWVGNEDGLAHDPVDYAVGSTELSTYVTDTQELAEARYLPPECDVSIRRGWFWAEDDEPKSVEHLLAIYYASIGRGANLLLNLPPDHRGLLPDEDVARVLEWRAELDDRFPHPVPATLASSSPHAWTLTFDRPTQIDHVILHEDYEAGQRVTGHRIAADGVTLAEAMTIGEQRIHAFAPVVVSELTIELTGEAAVLLAAEAYDTGGRTAPSIDYLSSHETPDVVRAG